MSNKNDFKVGDRVYFPIQMTVTDVHEGWVFVTYDGGLEDCREPNELAHVSSTEQLRSGLEALLERWHPKHDRGSHGENFEAVLAELRTLLK